MSERQPKGTEGCAGALSDLNRDNLQCQVINHLWNEVKMPRYPRSTVRGFDADALAVFAFVQDKVAGPPAIGESERSGTNRKQWRRHREWNNQSGIQDPHTGCGCNPIGGSVGV